MVVIPSTLTCQDSFCHSVFCGALIRILTQYTHARTKVRLFFLPLICAEEQLISTLQAIVMLSMLTNYGNCNLLFSGVLWLQL